MPIIAVVGAIAATAVAATSVAAVGLTLVTALEVVAAVGATLGAVGAVTKNKTLMMVGGAIGAIGAIGGIAAGAGLLGEAANAPLFGTAPAASTADAAASAGGGFAEGLTPATSGASGAAGGAIDAGTWGGEAASTGMSVADAASANTIPFVADGLPAGQTDLTTLTSVAKDASDPAAALAKSTDAMNSIDPAKDLMAVTDPSKGLINQPTGGLIDTPPAPPNMLGTTDPTTGQNITSAVDPVKGIVSLPDESPGVFGRVMKFANDNKTLVSGALTVGGKLLEGLTSEVTPAQIKALNAQAAANDAAAAMANQRTANLAMPKAVASTAPVTGTPGQIIPQRTGFINQPQLAPVTGAPA